MIKKSFLFLFSALTLTMAQSPISTISDPITQDRIRGKNKSGIIFGATLGLPSVPTQYLYGQRFENVTSYGYGLMIGYQDFARVISPLPYNFGGARASFEFNDVYHISSSTIHSNSFLLNYDILIDPLARGQNLFGLIFGVNTGLTYIQSFQGFSFSVGLKFGISANFDQNNRLEITYRVAKSGPLQGSQLYFYSPYTINLTYTFRFDAPKPRPIPMESDFDNTKFLIKAQ